MQRDMSGRDLDHGKCIPGVTFWNAQFCRTEDIVSRMNEGSLMGGRTFAVKTTIATLQATSEYSTS